MEKTGFRRFPVEIPDDQCRSAEVQEHRQRHKIEQRFRLNAVIFRNGKDDACKKVNDQENTKNDQRQNAQYLFINLQLSFSVEFSIHVNEPLIVHCQNRIIPERTADQRNNSGPRSRLAIHRIKDKTRHAREQNLPAECREGTQ